MRKISRIEIGVDEVGKGPIAGPVAVGAFVFLDEKAKRLFRGVKESKQLSEKERERWFSRIESAKKSGLVDFRVTFQSEKVIDERGLSFAMKKALKRSLDGLHLDPRVAEVLLDGRLKAPSNYLNQKTIIKGDEKIKAIALASICAKVLRDRKMNRLALDFPKYGFDLHKGYGTRKHYYALREFGLLDCHRRSFLGRLEARIEKQKNR